MSDSETKRGHRESENSLPMGAGCVKRAKTEKDEKFEEDVTVPVRAVEVPTGNSDEDVVEGLKVPESNKDIGKQMAKDGLEIVNNRSIDYVYPTEEMVRDFGKEKFLGIFTRFYERLFADPLMNVLFNESSDERPPSEHGLLLGSFIVGFITGSGDYGRVLRSGVGHGLGYGHIRAKRCPHRPAKDQGRGFLRSQAMAWLGHLNAACKDVGAPDDLRKTLTSWLGNQLFRYGPFIEDEI